jgi:para-nitrobenzyl esterase
MRQRARFLAVAGIAAGSILATVSAASAQLVPTDSGPVQGHVNDGTQEFLGIPYAAPPLGSLRFSPPQPPASWVTALQATDYPPACSQLPILTNGNNHVVNEDCLYLNVWTPSPAPTTPLPVMIWIHGGSNTSGSTADFVPFPGFETDRLYDGHTISKVGNVIVVTVNYRLNAFGFFGMSEVAAEDLLYPYAGNQGLLDQRKAMQWVQTNIANFGGDPANVTIFGESAGSWDVCSHVVSPMDDGLFERAISESGGCSVGVKTAAEEQQAVDAVVAAVHCDTAMDRLACMRAVPASDLLDASPLLSTETTDLAISVDGGFLPELPKTTLTNGSARKVPYILGSNYDEGTLFTLNTPDMTEDEYTATLLDRFGSFAPQVEALYPAGNFASPKAALTRVVGDSTLTCSTMDVAKRYASAHNHVWTYEFKRAPNLGGAIGTFLGAFHGSEIGYVFASVQPAPTPADAMLSTLMEGFWTSFAKYGKPKPQSHLPWAKFNPKSYKSVRFDVTSQKFSDYRRAECDFWTQYYDATNP